MLIDTHSHLNFSAYKNDLDEVIRRTQKENIWTINIGSKYENSKRAIEIAKNYGGMFAAVGLHPIHLAGGFLKVNKDIYEEEEGGEKADDFNINKYKEIALSAPGKVVAIGEIGLDYYYRPETKTKLELFKNKQKEFFVKQLELAQELNLPVILHCRMAHQDLLKVLKSQILNLKSQINPKSQNPIKGVIHCFTGTLAEAQEYIKMGFFIGINGIIFKLDLNEVIKQIPLEKILIETDCPYLIPKPRDGAGTPVAEGDLGVPPKADETQRVPRNEPVFIKYIVKKIAEIKNTDYNTVAKITTDNARKLFNI